MLFKTLRILTILSLFLISFYSFSEENETIQVYRGMTVQYAEPVEAGYVLKAKKGGESSVQIINGQLFITGKSGKSVVQVILKNGTVKNIIVETLIPPPQVGNISANSTANNKGYNFVLNSNFSERKSQDKGKKLSQKYHNNSLLLNTKVGNHSKFLLSVSERNDFPIYYYTRIDYDHVYIAHGDASLLVNKYIPSFLRTPSLRQNQTGYNSDNFSIDFWNGKSSPTPPSIYKYIEITSPENTNFYNTYGDSYYGLRTKYSFDKLQKNSIFASYWSNPKANKPIPYVGGSFQVNPHWQWNTTFGNSSKEPVVANSLIYNSLKQTERFSIQDFTFTHELAGKGYDNLYFSSMAPRESIQSVVSIYSNNRYRDEGSIYITPGFNYLLDGYSTTYEEGILAGWQNTNLNVYTAGKIGTQKSTIDQPSNYYKLNPGFEFWLNDKKAPVRYAIDANQDFYKFKNASSSYQIQETSWGFKAKTNLITGRLGLSRLSTEHETQSSSGYKLNPSIEYVSAKFKLSAYANFSFNQLSNSIGNINSNYQSEKFGVNGSLNIDKNNLISLRIADFKDNHDRSYQNYTLGYVFKYGDNQKSIISLFDSHKLKVHFFEDINFNGIQDSNEKGISNIKLNLSRIGEKLEGISDKDGVIKLSGLADDIYYTSISSESLSNNYVLLKTISNLNFKSNDNIDIAIPIIQMRNVTVSMKSDSSNNDSIDSELKCEKKGNSSFILKNNGDTVIAVPEHDICKLNIILTKYNFSSIDQNNIDLSNKTAITFNINNSFNIIGQAFEDKNHNGTYDFGEELAGVIINLNNTKILSNENGIWSQNFKEIDSLSFKNVQKSGYNCKEQFKPKINENNLKEILKIMCFRKK